jgi:hypothetical protein
VTYSLVEKPEGGYDGKAWMKVAKPALRERNAFINLPYVVDHSNGGLIVTQSTAVYTFLGRAFSMMGEDEEELVACEQSLAQAFDLRNDLMKIVYPFGGVTPENFAQKLEAHLEGSVRTHYSKFEGFLQASGSGFVCRSGLSAGDFHLFEMLDQHEMMAARHGLPSPLASFPRLAALREQMRSLPELAEYFASAAYRLPCNNKMANFK